MKSRVNVKYSQLWYAPSYGSLAVQPSISHIATLHDESADGLLSSQCFFISSSMFLLEQNLWRRTKELDTCSSPATHTDSSGAHLIILLLLSHASFASSLLLPIPAQEGQLKAGKRNKTTLSIQNLQPFNSQYPQTNSPNRSPYIFLNIRWENFNWQNVQRLFPLGTILLILFYWLCIEIYCKKNIDVDHNTVLKGLLTSLRG